MSTKSGTTSSGRSSSTNSLNQAENDEQQPQPQQQVTQPEQSPDPKARLCHLRKWPHFQGYGFNLHAERSKMGQHIGKVDANSPAESAGLKEGDRIIEVNLVNISNENHQQVVKRIRSGLDYEDKSHEDEVLLLVVDKEADEWFKSRGIVVRSNGNPDLIVKLTTASLNDEDASDHNNNQMTNSTKEAVTKEANIMNSSNNSNNNNSSNNNNTSSNSNELGSPSNSEKPSSGRNSANGNQPNRSNSNSSLNVVATPTPTSPQQSLPQQSTTPRSSISSNSNKVNKPQVNQQQPKTSPTNSNGSSSASSTLSTASSSANRPDLIKTNSNNNKSSASPKDDLYRINENPKSSVASLRIKEPNKRMIRPNFSVSSKISSSSVMGKHDALDSFLEMSAAEFKNYLKSKGRNDPRGVTIDMRRKYEIFQNM